MELLVLFGVLFILLAIGVPVAFSLLAAALCCFAAMGIPPIVAVQRVAAGISVFTLMAIPFFIFAGDLMYRAGIADRLVRVADAAVGRVRGGLGIVDVGASMMFGAVSGSAIASASAIGSTMVPLMRDKGYPGDYAVNVTVTAAIVGLLIPPSHNMIIYSAASGIGVSIGDLFLAGIVPGLLTGAMLMLAAWLVARRRGLPVGRFPGWREFIRAAAYAIPGLMTAVIIMGGILSGFFTPTESSAVAVVYTVAIGALVYRSLGWRGTWEAAAKSVRTASMVLFIIAAATAFGFALALLEVPAALASLIALMTENPLLTLLIINLMLLALGTFMDMAPLIVITTPIFLPVAMGVGVDPVHFGIIMMLNLGIGLVTPPVGSVLFVGSAVGKVPVTALVRTIWPFYLTLVAALLLITYVPALSLWLPQAIGQ
ncbi:TRAP transporter large permease [Pelagerythrobacter marinus]|uniref:TRAP transporter large permease protein n=1 Tax=Pelagerythrobacter marinus TaxID=538382 RepID=A0ABW9V0H3_9SPHN|nr:TRAP transporter large permease [Pelagerythrobacter marinus]MEC9067270.1 TRAP transporter large permease [Pseudomonadota bacterium]MXO69540.1 TRAP transporter large permease subunit [Pelagerythrobacter marinus]USA39415.1 TRAP transporter large permease [Pelagerythrobacter marinus]WPZ06445.1 TRAP transporter large permease [Pelagerythrobacter marinus]